MPRIRRLAFALLLAAGVPWRADAQLPAAPASSPAPITFGGYAGITLRRAPDSAAVRIAESNVAALLSGSVGTHVSYLAEFDAVSSSRQNYAGRQDDRQFEVARLYVEASANDLLRVRVGRFLTPIGQWNEIHAEPLTWTAVRPLATYRSFAKYSTGALLAGQGSIAGHDAGYALWAAPDFAARNDDAEIEFGGAAGLRVAAEVTRGFFIGASGAVLRDRRPASSFDDDSLEAGGVDDYLYDDNDDREARALLGFDATWHTRVVELRAEGTWLRGAEAQRDEQTAFLQAVVPLLGGLSATGRAEVATNITGGTLRTSLVGLHWRAPFGTIVKLEMQTAPRAPAAVARGWFLSVSSLF